LLLVKGGVARVYHSGTRSAEGETLVALVRKGAEERFRAVSGSDAAVTSVVPA
jgi:hypothetical protein